METILLVDDEADVVATARKMLEEVGYQILDALNAEGRAVRIWPSSWAFSGPR
jgi:CheY-like chemotaxis protein